MHVLTRGEHNRRLAEEFGVDSVGAATDVPPEPLDGAILFAPAGDLVPGRAAGARPRGPLAVAGIWLSTIRRWTTPPSCSRSAGCAPFPPTPAATVRSPPPGGPPGRPRHHLVYSLDDAPRALSDLASGRFGGGAVLHA